MKMLFVCLFLVCFVPINAQGQGMDIEYIRLNYEKAIADKELCNAMIEALATDKEKPVYLAYLGGLQTVWANHVINPISKLRTFKEGRKNLEKAVELAPNDIEIRFIRLSIQKNAPRFLGYHQQVETDEEFIKQHQQSIKSASLLQLINKL